MKRDGSKQGSYKNLAERYGEAWVRELAQATAGEPRTCGPRRFVRMFKPQFAPGVAAGTKRQTIRPVPHVVPRKGDLLSLRQWTDKPYRSPQRVLREATITQVKFCHIDAFGVLMQPPDGSLLAIAGARMIQLRTADDLNRFARSDGFETFEQMVAWFHAQHGLPFDGIILYWE